MNRAEFDELNNVCGIDTFEIATNVQLTEKVQGITTKTPLQACSSHDFLFKYKVNPDKIIEDGGNSIDKFKQVLQYIVKHFKGATELFISRIDYRFDDMSNDYSRFYKLNRLLLSMIATAYSSQNNYASSDLLTAEKLTVRFDCDHNDLHISGEYYNKERQEPSGEVKTRLELRSRQLYIPFLDGCDYESFILAEWLERLQEVINKDNFNTVIQNSTESLIDLYNKEQAEFGNVTEFLTCYRDNIYTSRQLTQLYSILNNAETAKQCAYKYRHGDKKNKGRKLPCFSIVDLQLYVDKLTAAAYKFFESQTESHGKAA